MDSQDQINSFCRAMLKLAVVASVFLSIGLEKGTMAAPAIKAAAAPAVKTAAPPPAAAPKLKLLTFDFPTRADLGTVEVFNSALDVINHWPDQSGKNLMRGKVVLPEGHDVGLTLSYYGLENVKYLAQLSRGVRVTQFSAARLEMDDTQAEILKNFPAIYRANFDNTLITDKTLKVLGQLKALSDLRLSATDVTGSAFDELDGKPLTIFNISGINMKPGSLSKIKSLPQNALEINCSKVRLTAADFAVICRCTKLTSLDISGNGEIDDKLAAQLANLKQLYVLKVFDTKITEKSLAMLSKIPTLKILTVRDKSFWLVKRGKSPRATLTIEDSGGTARTPADLFEPLH